MGNGLETSKMRCFACFCITYKEQLNECKYTKKSVLLRCVNINFYRNKVIRSVNRQL